MIFRGHVTGVNYRQKYGTYTTPPTICIYSTIQFDRDTTSAIAFEIEGHFELGTTFTIEIKKDKIADVEEALDNVRPFRK